MASAVPLNGQISFEELAKVCGIAKNDAERFLRVAIARHIFQEPILGYIAHTAASRMLLDNPMLEAWILNIAQEFWPSLARVRVESGLNFSH